MSVTALAVFDSLLLRILLGIVLPLIIGGWQYERLFLRNRTHRREALLDRLLSTVRQLARQQPELRLAVYATPNGLRVLALHDTYQPHAPVAIHLQQALGTDPTYLRLCRVQGCFRARVSPKPWRIGIRAIRPGGVWPVPPERVADRADWIARYEAAAQSYAACRFLEELGNGPTHSRCLEVQRMHDELSRARSELPIA